MVDFAESNGLRIRGHALIWARLNGLLGWLTDEVNGAPDPAAYLRQFIQEYIATVVGRYRGRIPSWDVVNEPLHLADGVLDPASLFAQVLGEEYIDLAFRVAREADPDAQLVLNETVDINGEVKFAGLLELVSRLAERGTPIDMIGLQSHFALEPPPSRERLRSQLEAIAELGYKAEITELDIPLSHFQDEPDPLAAQADAFAKVFGACLDVPACTGVTTWGLYDAESWLDEFIQGQPPARPLLLDESFQPKPAYWAVRDLLLEGRP